MHKIATLVFVKGTTTGCSKAFDHTKRTRFISFDSSYWVSIYGEHRELFETEIMVGEHYTAVSNNHDLSTKCWPYTTIDYD